MERLEFERSRLRLAGILSLSPILVATSYFCTTLEDPPYARVVGWIGVVFFGLAAIPIIGQIVRGGVAIVLSAEGIEDARLGVGLIPWRDVSQVWVAKVRSSRFVCIRLVHRETYVTRLPTQKRVIAWVNRSMGFGDLAISFQGLRPGIDEALAYIERVRNKEQAS